MTYTTRQKLEDRYGTRELVRLTDLGETATGIIDAGRVDGVIASVQSIIDGYIGKRYVLPLAQTPPLIARIAEILAYYDLHLVEADEKTKADQKEAMAQLRDIQAGKLSLPVAETTPAETGGTGARVTDRGRPFTEDKLKGWI